MINRVGAFESFCTPPPSSDRAARIVASADPWVVQWQGGSLHGWRTGPTDGRTALVVHGWGSRSDSMGLLAASLSNAGLNTFAIDMPAHGRTLAANPRLTTANLKIWVEALKSAGAQLMPTGVDCIIGHSFGGLASAFSLAATPWSGSRILSARRLVLLATPSGMDDIIASDARKSQRTPDEVAQIQAGVETVLDGPARLGCIELITGFLPPVLTVSDPLDPIAPLENLACALSSHSEKMIVPLEGATHEGILINRTALRLTAKFAAG